MRYVFDTKQRKVVPVSERTDAPPRAPLSPFIQPDYPAYYSHGTCTWVEGRRARREDLKRSGCREMDPSEIKEVDRATSEFQRSQAELASERNVSFERQEYQRGR